MRLHRALAQPDWDLVPPSQRNVWQRVAAGTHGLATPGNIVSVVGLVLTLLGLGLVAGEVYGWGLLFIAGGRLCDVLDGMLAEATATKAPLGETLDAGIDKLVTIVGLLMLVSIGVLPWVAAIAVFMPNVATAVMASVAQRRQRRIHPSRAGKLAMASAWIGLFGFVAAAAGRGEIVNALWLCGYGFVVVSFVLGCRAVVGYARLALISSK